MESILNKLVLRDVLLLIIAILAMKVTAGIFILVIVLSGCVFAFQKKSGKLAFCFFSLFFLQNVNFAIIPMTVFTNLGCKTGFMLMSLCMLSGATKRGCFEKLPFGLLFLYLGCMVVSSAVGYFPMISYLKLFNYTFFLCSVCLIVKYIQVSAVDLLEARAALIAIAFMLVVGSLAVYPFPDIGYSMNVRVAMRYGIYMTGQEAMEKAGSLFNGLTWHSQALAPMAAISFVYVAMDMLFLEKKARIIHLSILLVAPIVMFMTRSRTAILTMVLGVLAFYFYAQQYVQIPQRLRRHMKMAVSFAIIICIIIGTILEIKDQTFTKWIRKTDNVDTDTRSLSEAVSNTRMGAWDENIDDFTTHPVFGIGFQVSRQLKSLYKEGAWVNIFSAPVEKGITPLVVFAEGGAIGGTIFLLFVLMYFLHCISRRNVCMFTLFVVIMTSNLSESTFFSPSGCGGYMFVFAFIGGVVLDACIKRARMPNTYMYI